MTSTVRPKADRRKKTITGSEAMALTGSGLGGVAPADIARRAFELFCARGCQHGSDLDDWLRAERELRGGSTGPRKRGLRKTASLD